MVNNKTPIDKIINEKINIRIIKFIKGLFGSFIWKVRHYLRLRRSLITKYIDKKTERIVNTTVNTGNSKATISSSFIPPNTPIKIIAIIWNAIVEYFA